MGVNLITFDTVSDQVVYILAISVFTLPPTGAQTRLGCIANAISFFITDPGVSETPKCYWIFFLRFGNHALRPCVSLCFRVWAFVLG